MVLWNSVNWTPHADHRATSANGLIRNSCAVSHFYVALSLPPFGLLSDAHPDQLPPIYVVIAERLAPAERPERRSTSQEKSVRRSVPVKLCRLQHHKGNRLEFILYFLMHIFKNEPFIAEFMRLFMYSPGQVWKSPPRPSWIAWTTASCCASWLRRCRRGSGKTTEVRYGQS